METNNEKKKVVTNDELENEILGKKEARDEENIDKNSSSKVASTIFEKKHGRGHNSFGDGHEPGTIPGTGV